MWLFNFSFTIKFTYLICSHLIQNNLHYEVKKEEEEEKKTHGE